LEPAHETVGEQCFGLLFAEGADHDSVIDRIPESGQSLGAAV
jgi:hypothetical protein